MFQAEIRNDKCVLFQILLVDTVLFFITNEFVSAITINFVR